MKLTVYLVDQMTNDECHMWIILHRTDLKHLESETRLELLFISDLFWPCFTFQPGEEVQELADVSVSTY